MKQIQKFKKRFLKADYEIVAATNKYALIKCIKAIYDSILPVSITKVLYNNIISIWLHQNIHLQ